MEIRGEIEVFPTEVQDLLRGLAKKGLLCGWHSVRVVGDAGVPPVQQTDLHPEN